MLIRTLRKGHTFVDLQYENTCDSITAEEFEAEVKDGVAVFRFSLRPSGGNQKFDENNLHACALASVVLNEPQVLKNLRSFNEARKTEYSRWVIEILSRGKAIKFNVKPSIGSSGQLQFTVLREAAG